jgi:hypothetical protein
MHVHMMLTRWVRRLQVLLVVSSTTVAVWLVGGDSEGACSCACQYKSHFPVYRCSQVFSGVSNRVPLSQLKICLTMASEKELRTGILWSVKSRSPVAAQNIFANGLWKRAQNRCFLECHIAFPCRSSKYICQWPLKKSSEQVFSGVSNRVPLSQLKICLPMASEKELRTGIFWSVKSRSPIAAQNMFANGLWKRAQNSRSQHCEGPAFSTVCQQNRDGDESES